MIDVLEELMLTESTAMGFVPIEKCFVDHRYQRQLKPKLLNVIVEEGWNKAIEGLPLGSLRDNGMIAVIDGQTRLEAAKQLKSDGKYPYNGEFPMKTFSGLTLEREAELFEFSNSPAKRRGAIPEEIIRSQIFRQESTAMKIKGIIESHGFFLALNRENSARYINCVSMLRVIIDTYGDSVLDDVFKIISLAWGPGERAAHSAPMIRALSTLVVTRKAQMDMDYLIKALSEREPDTYILESRSVAAARGTKYTVIRHLLPTLVEQYNKNRRSDYLQPILPTEQREILRASSGKFVRGSK